VPPEDSPTASNEDRLRDYLKRVTADLRKARRQLRDIEKQSGEPIAIVGMSCRYPGGADTPEGLWQLLAAGRDAVSGFPTDREWDLEGLYDSDPDRPRTSYVREGSFLHAAGEFDAGFFGVSPREALAMDPQQRLLLEVAWDAVEYAGVDPLSLRGSRTGVFAGLIGNSYAFDPRSMPEELESYLGTGNTASVASGRIAFTLGLEGPAVTVDTACSSSLVALHLACQSLHAGECSLALAGGAAVMATPVMFMEFSRQRALAGDGRCKSFAAAADGTGWGEGAGMLLLERLSDAQRLGHRVLALVRGSAVNQDGASNGLTAPNGPAQQRVIAQALASARLSAEQIDVVEAHGTGTRLGDPIEAQALLAAYGQERPPGRPLWLGSLKSNIGHTQAAAGVAGVIKMVKALEHELLPRTLHVDEPSREVDWSAGEVSLLVEDVSWPRAREPRRAGVSSFGLSGTNAHVILEEPPVLAEGGGVSVDGGGGVVASVSVVGGGVSSDGVGAASGVGVGVVVPWVLSGRGVGGVGGQAGRLLGWCEGVGVVDGVGGVDVGAGGVVDGVGGVDAGVGVGVGGVGVVDVGFSLAGRSVFDRRAVVLGGGCEGLLGGLGALVGGRDVVGVVEGVVAPGVGGGSVFLFPGQGSQWVGMAVGLLDSSPVFAEGLRRCGEALGLFVDWSLEGVLRGEVGAPPLERVDVVQPVLFGVMVALAGLWRACGVEPGVVVGHSQGEIAAVCVAGGLSLEDAARLVVLRSRLLVGLMGRGGMVSVALGVGEVRERLVGWGGRVGVAAVNGPGSVVLSGERGALDELLGVFVGEGVRAREIPVGYASHSVHVEEVREEFLAGCGGIVPCSGGVPFFSTVTGGLVDMAGLGGEYWYRNLRETVRFEEVVRLLLGEGYRAFVEVSPHPVLTVGVQETVDEVVGGSGGVGGESGVGEGSGGVVVVGSLRRGEGGLECFLGSLARAWVRGVGVDWRAVYGGSGGRRVELPAYAFQRQHYWQAPVVGASRVAPRERKIDGWRYRIDWKGVAESSAATPTGTWLLVSPALVSPAGSRAAWVDALTDALRAHGAKILSLGVRESELDRDVLAGRLRELLAGESLLDESLAGEPSVREVSVSEQQSENADVVVNGVLSLLALDGDLPVVLDGDPPMAPAAGAHVEGALALLQALGDADIQGPLWVATRGAVSVGPSDPLDRPAQAQVWGLGRTLALEESVRWGGLIDLPPAPDEDSIGRLCGVLAGGSQDDQVAVRGTGVFVPRLVHARPRKETGREAWRPPPGTVLLTGGTGALGRHVARWLAREGAEHLLLLSRRGTAAAGATGLEAELVELGAQVTIAACDVGDREQLAALLETVPVDRPLCAVVHAAGVFDFNPIDLQTGEQVRRTLAPKAYAAWHLHELTAHLELSAFVLFSSIAGTFGSGQQGGYAAANAFLDALALHRRQRGLTATSLAWGLWGEGMGALGGEYLRRRGLIDMPPELAIEALQRALDHDESFELIADINWEDYVPAYTLARSRPLIARLPEVQQILQAPQEPVDGASAGPLALRLGGLREAEHERVARELVDGEVRAVLGNAAPDAIGAGRAFKDLGFDSVTALELRNRISTATGLRLPATLIFDHPTIGAVARHLLDEVAGVRREPARSTGAKGDTQEPIAIVGMGCRYPGEVDTPQALWELVAEGRDAISEFPVNRGWDLERVYDPDPGHPGTSYVREGGFLHDADEFDAGFFDVSPGEALSMDPQQRLLLEVCWEAFENAGIDPVCLRGSQTAVFAGVGSHDFSMLMSATPASLRGYLVTAISPSVISGRVAYALGLEGAAITVDTGCSSSLVALHLACQALRAGECSLALAGGVTVMSTPTAFTEFSRQQALAPDGRCKAFAAAADGTGWSEGAGVLVAERLSDARRLGHPVLGLVRGSAVNQDGASNGLTAPNGPSQQRVIAQALASAGLTAADVDAVEAHGTGTKLGDPIEAQALLATYGRERPPGRPLWLGSLKSNIGHAQAAGGVAGVIKIVKALEHGLLPRTLHVDEPSREVDWSAGEVSLLVEEVPWQANGRPRRAGISSFGVSGTNAHVILEEPPVLAEGGGVSVDGGGGVGVGVGVDGDAGVGVASASASRVGVGVGVGVVVPWVLSGRGVGGVGGQAGRLLGWCEGVGVVDGVGGVDVGAGGVVDGVGGVDAGVGVGVGGVGVVDVGFSLAGRSVFDRRAVVLGGGCEGLLGGLGALVGGRDVVGVVEGVVAPGVGGGSVFLFPGQGSQWVGMAVGLLDSSPVFAEGLRRCGEALGLFVDWSLEGVLRGEVGAPPLERVDVVQPVLFGVMVALAGLWRACGVEPGVVVGHSQGEIAAVCVAGGLSLEDAARLVVLRSRLLVGLMGRGGMVSVALGVGEVRERLVGWGGRVGVAAVNGPGSVVLSGERGALDELLGVFVGEGVRAREIPVGYASHSVHVEEVREEFLAGCGGIVPCSGGVPFFSTVTGGLVDMAGLGGEYWYRNLRETVRFEEVVRLLLGEGYRAFVEVSPHPVLTVGVQETVDEVVGGSGGVGGESGVGEGSGGVVVVGSLRRGEGGLECFLGSLARAWVRGVGVDWRAVYGGSGGRRVELPAYAFQRQHYWLDASVGGIDGLAPAAGSASAPNSPGDQTDGVTGEWGALARSLAEVHESERQSVVLELVRRQTAIVLGDDAPESIGSQIAFKDLGFTSVMAVELRNRLAAKTDLHFPVTAIFDCPTPAALAERLLEEIAQGKAPDQDSLDLDLDRLELKLASMTDEAGRSKAARRLLAALSGSRDSQESQLGEGVAQEVGEGVAREVGEGVAQEIRSASDEDVFRFIDRVLGSPEGAGTALAVGREGERNGS
jgi:acyl transferase domain-containing protein/acyl carrier protein